MFLTGDETGLLKVVSGSSTAFVFGEQNRELAVSAMCHHPDAENNLISVLRRNGSLEHWKIDFEQDNNNAPVLRLINSVEDVVEEALALAPIRGGSVPAMLAVGCNGQMALQSMGSDYSVVREFKVDGPLSAAAAVKCHVLVGGQERDVSLFDLETNAQAWKAKNVINDKLNLRVPVWVTSIAPLSDADHSKFLTGTAHKHVRLYDINAGDRPTVSYDIDTAFSITGVNFSADKKSFYVSDGGGNLFQHDLSTGRRIHTLKGCTGSIRSMTLSSGGASLACVGLDRHMRVYNSATGKLRTKTYLKNRLNAVVELSTTDSTGKQQAGTADAEDEGEEGNESEGEGDGDEFSELGSDFSDSEPEEEEDAPQPAKKKRA